MKEFLSTRQDNEGGDLSGEMNVEKSPFLIYLFLVFFSSIFPERRQRTERGLVQVGLS